MPNGVVFTSFFVKFITHMLYTVTVSWIVSGNKEPTGKFALNLGSLLQYGDEATICQVQCCN